MHLDFFKFVRVKSYESPLKNDTQAAKPFSKVTGYQIKQNIFRRILIWKDGANRKSKIEI